MNKLINSDGELLDSLLNPDKIINGEKFDKVLRKGCLKEREDLKNKLYLSEIVELEKPTFGSNSLILAPVGSGKSKLIEKKLIPENYTGNIIYLVSNTTLKDAVCPIDSVERKLIAEEGKSEKMFTSANKSRYGDKPYNIHVMSYHEFGERVFSPHQKFTKDVGIIFCDEIHSLPTHHSYDRSSGLGAAMYFLFNKHDNIQIYYFTATADNLIKFGKQFPDYLEAVTVYNYLNHPNIRKYVVNSTYYINHIEQIRPHLQAKLEGFNYYGYKGLAFSKLISDQERIAEIAKEVGYKPIVLWSINNEREMSEEQLRVRTQVLRTGLIPNEYNLLIINASMQEGWDLNDPDMRLAIMDTTNVTEQVQALGRIRQDVEILVCKTKNVNLVLDSFTIPDKYIDVVLTPALKEELCQELNIVNAQGRLRKWTSIKRYITDVGYILTEEMLSVDGKNRSCAKITKM